MKKAIKLLISFLLVFVLSVTSFAAVFSDDFDEGFMTFNGEKIAVNASTKAMSPRMVNDGKGGFYLSFVNTETIGEEGGYFADNLGVSFDPWGKCGNNFVVLYNVRVNKCDYIHDVGSLLFEVQWKTDQGWSGNYAPFGIRADGKGGAYMGCIRDTETDNIICELGRWYTVACAYDMAKDECNVYIDGEKAYKTQVTNGDVFSAYTLALFGITDATSHPFNIDLGDIYIFSGSSPADLGFEVGKPTDVEKKVDTEEEEKDDDVDTEADTEEEKKDDADKKTKSLNVKPTLIASAIAFVLVAVAITALVVVFTREKD